MTDLKLITLADLFGSAEAKCPHCGAYTQMNRHFRIPDYQRGYRWTVTQVEALLNDLWDFHNQTSRDATAWYSLQPLVVAPHDKDKSWNVVDGQQRLTTLWIILQAFGCRAELLDGFSITYDTRPESWSFLQNLERDTAETHDVDFHFMRQAHDAIKQWKDSNPASATPDFFATIMSKCKLIWYVVDSADAEKTFERLNTGKIPLTPSELIKALYMVTDNGISEHEKMEISKEWEVIENALRDDRFWYMLNTKESTSATRIDFLFDLVADVVFKPEDEYQTFRKFEEFSRQTGVLLDKWQACRDLFWQFQGWYDDLECYHYVGLLRLCTLSIKEVLALSESEKPLSQILAFKLVRHLGLQEGFSLDEKKQFDYDTPPLRLRLLFVLFNVETLNMRHREQQKKLVGKADDATRYLGYERFPFDLYHLQGWDIEHVSSQTANQLTMRPDQKEWLENSRCDLREYVAHHSDADPNAALWEKVQAFLDLPEKQPESPNNKFIDLWTEIKRLAGEAEETAGGSNDLGNLTLLDCGTNRSYKNALFPTKRRKILERDKSGLYIPICTRHVFLKYYTEKAPKISRWDEATDGKNYFRAITDVMRALYEKAGINELPTLLKTEQGVSA